jgi:hypothetical protein
MVMIWNWVTVQAKLPDEHGTAEGRQIMRARKVKKLEKKAKKLGKKAGKATKKTDKIVKVADKAAKKADKARAKLGD